MFAKLLRKSLIVFIGTSVFSGTVLSQDYKLEFEPANPEEVVALKWEDLMSQADLAAILDAPPVSHDGYGWDDKFSADSTVENAFQRALQSFDVNPEFVGKRVVLPGFVVPTAYNDERKVTEFFLVPFLELAFMFPRLRRTRSFMSPMIKDCSWIVCTMRTIFWESFLARLCDTTWQTRPTV